MALDGEERELLKRLTEACEGIEVLLAMWLEHSIPAGEIWVEEGPDRSLAKRLWRPAPPE
jgi:hypothetical protein